MSVPLHLYVREHDTLVRGTIPGGSAANVQSLPTEAFDAIQALLLHKGSDLNPVAVPTRAGGRDALKLTQWVGLLRAPDGTTVEVLPKTHERPGGRSVAGSLERSRALLLRMLAATDERFRVAPPAELDATRMPLYEVVIRYVLEGIKAAVRRGIPHAYRAVQEERAGLRGRLNLPRQVRQPPYRAHLLHVEYDEYLPDRAETRLTRLTVERCQQLTRESSSKRLGRELLVALDAVPSSRNVHQDFQDWRLERGHPHFAPLEGLCRLVLYELNPLVSGQTAQAQALLFDMNRVYEAYVAVLLRAQFPELRVATQVSGQALGHVHGAKAFMLRPDLLLTLPDGQVIIADTKWKRLKPESIPTYDVSNADAYQMLAYSHVFQATQPPPDRKLWLIYPRLPGLPEQSQSIQLLGGSTLHLLMVDLDAPTLPFPLSLITPFED
ncbi:hypothetical protein GCM10008955_26340 [Deinococcus malanensis]|uniref:Restriction endonuclease n=1 Tax=Deinococcus malanensis TaxID=1706855 RepID=A0ABQ2F0L2_9DEIO|nr:hypothetical protein [Deinococcus malanensis]GGK31216.1 hypothetical protein GCM10008955_26340 [Deinococcus malanensis]